MLLSVTLYVQICVSHAGVTLKHWFGHHIDSKALCVCEEIEAKANCLELMVFITVTTCYQLLSTPTTKAVVFAMLFCVFCMKYHSSLQCSVAGDGSLQDATNHFYDTVKETLCKLQKAVRKIIHVAVGHKMLKHMICFLYICQHGIQVPGMVAFLGNT